MNYVLIDTIAAMEHELETLTTMVVNTKVGSPDWVMYNVQERRGNAAVWVRLPVSQCGYVVTRVQPLTTVFIIRGFISGQNGG